MSVGKKLKYEEYLNSVNHIKRIYQEEEESLINNYLANLECDYPDIYNILMAAKEEEIVAVTGIEFDNEELIIGLADAGFRAKMSPKQMYFRKMQQIKR